MKILEGRPNMLFLFQLLKAMLIITGFIVLIVGGMFLGSISIWHKVREVPDRGYTFPDDEISITWIGHSTMLLNLKGTRILTDPMYSDFILLLAKRYYEPAIPLEKLPHIDAVVISHEHYDHLDMATLEQLPPDTPVIIRRGNSERVIKAGIRDIRELDIWESTKVKDINITAVPAKHGRANACGFVIEGPKNIYFAGDTAYFPGIKEIGDKFELDIALLPISHYRTPQGRKNVDAMLRTIHMGPWDFPEAIQDLRVETAIPMHHKTFRNVGILELPLDEPERFMREIVEKYKLQGIVHILDFGEKITF
ncbi:MAG: MBL fold metallo-hydrolase [Acidobacteria bacterium]|nr:MBL fold metallo-hydrolase [Acidobacteriota bacterium]